MATLTDDQKRQAEDAARKVLNETFGNIELVEFPIDLNAVLDRFAISLKKGPFADSNISGAFSRNDNTIYISSAESPERQAFTIAHEVGHYRLHEDRTTDILYRKQIWQFTNGGLAPDETQANWFAANLLMPSEAVTRMWKITHDIGKLSAFFGVSRPAMGFRLKDLGLIKN
jgi:Zn-dependent peptidase ImmA (M78 family)